MAAFAGNPIPADQFSLTHTSAGASVSGGSTALNKLWLPLWSGEVINAYDQYNIFEHLITYRPLFGGFSYEFPITGTIALKPSWDAGVELGGGASTTNTFKVNLDARPMAAHFETDNIDALVAQWDYRSELARQAGMTLSTTRDKQIISSLIAACALAPLTADPRGVLSFPTPACVLGNTTNPSEATARAVGYSVSNCTELTALEILKSIEDYVVNMQENDFPCGMVICAVSPKVFQVIRALGIPRTEAHLGTRIPMFGASDMYGGNGVPMAYGANALTDSLDYMSVKIVKTNHLPKVNLGITGDANSIGAAKYNLNCSLFDIYGIMFQPEAVAGLALQGLKVDTVMDIRRNTQFTVASMLMGTGVLRPELCKLIVGVIPTGTAISNSTTSTAALNTRVGLVSHLTAASNTNFTNGFAAEYFTS
jgi:hypothetical protein